MIEIDLNLPPLTDAELLKLRDPGREDWGHCPIVDDELYEKLLAAAERDRQSRWQPIETCPKCRRKEYLVGWFDPHDAEFHMAFAEWDVDWDANRLGGWMALASDTIPLTGDMEPKYWREVPQEPEFPTKSPEQNPRTEPEQKP